MVFGDVNEVQHALTAGVVSLHAKVKCRIVTDAADGELQPQLVETTPGRLLLYEILPHHPNVTFQGLINRILTKKEISQVIDEVYRHCGQKETVIFADRLMNLGFSHACKAGISFGKDDMIIPGRQVEPRPRHPGPGQAVRAAVLGRPDHQGREVQQGGRRLAAVLGQGRRGDDAGDPGRAADQAAGRPLPAAERDLDDGAFGCARLGGADQAARRHARPDGQALGRDHREPDHLELQGRPDRARVLQLDARRPQGPGRHRAEDRELGLPHPPSGRRGAGLHHHRRGLRHASGRSPSRPRAATRIWASASSAGPWPRTSSIRAPARCWRRATRCSTRSCAGRSTQSGVDSVRVRSVLTCDGQDRRLRPLLRPRPRARHDRQHRRGGGRHRRPVDRRAGHAAHHAHLPHRRCGAGLGRAVGDREPVRRRAAAGQPAAGARQHGPRRSSSAATPSSWSTTRSAARSCARSCPTAPGCGSSRTRRSRRARCWPSGIRTPCR